MNESLEQKRLAILTKIRLSRATYKNSLLGDTDEENRSRDIRSSFGIPNFPKSMTLKLIADHPILVIVTTGCLIYIATRSKILQGRKKSLTHYAENFVRLKKTINRAYLIGTHILKNPDHQHLVRWLGRLIGNKLSR